MAQLAMHEEPADHEQAESTPGTLTDASLTTFESRPLDQLEHLEVPPMRIAVELQIFGLTGAIAPAESVARNAVINVIKDATKAPQAYDIQVQCVGYAAGKIPTWTASAPNLCINVVITSTAPEAVWAKLRCKIMAIDWESVKQANFCTTFRRPRYPKAQWDSGATMHWIGYLGIPCSTFYASQDFFLDTLIELAGEWQATPFIEVYGGQVCLFLKFADLDPLMAAIPTFVSIVDDATGAEFFPTSSYVKGVRTLILGHLANIPDAKRTGASWWKLGVAMSTAAIRALLYQIGVDNAHLPVTACPLINNGLLEACFVSWATPEAANAVYQHCGWDRVQAFTIKGTNARAALFKFPTFIGNQRGYFADRRVLRAAAPAPAAARVHLNRASAPASPAAAGNGAEEGEIVPAAAAAPKRSRPSAEK